MAVHWMSPAFGSRQVEDSWSFCVAVSVVSDVSDVSDVSVVDR